MDKMELTDLNNLLEIEKQMDELLDELAHLETNYWVLHEKLYGTCYSWSASEGAGI